VKSIEDALTDLANLTDALSAKFPLDLEDSCSGISRAAADLHLFHHQVSQSPEICRSTRIEVLREGHDLLHQTSLILYLQEKTRTVDVNPYASSGGARALAYTSIGSARQTMNILTALLTNDLLGM
jgi:hypothetical protein